MILRYRFNLLTFLALIYPVLVIIPYFKSFFFYNYISFFFNISMSLLIFFYYIKNKKNLSMIWFLSHAGFIYIVLLSLITNNLFLIGRFSEYLILANCFQLLIYFYFNSLFKELNLIINVFIYSAVFSCITTLKIYRIDPFSSRLISDNPDLYSNNIGGYGFIYSLLFIFIALQILLISKKYNLKNKLIYIFILILFTLNIVNSNFLIATFLIIFLLILSFFFSRPPMFFRNKIIKLFIIFAFFFSLISIFNLFYQNENYIFTKAYDIYLSLKEGTFNTYLFERINNYLISLKGFLQFPIFGSIVGANNILDGEWFGRHSYILDNFSLFGIFGGIFYIFILIYPWFFYYQKFNLDFCSTFMASSSIFAIATANIITPEIIVAAYLIVPASALLIDSQNHFIKTRKIKIK